MEFCTNVALHLLHKEVNSQIDGVKSNDGELPENAGVTISPLGMCVILHMIANGATGATLDQLLHFLRVPKLDDLVTIASNLTQISKSSFETSDDDPKICNFNAVLVKERFTLNKDHQDFLESVSQAKVKHVDFSRKDEAVKEVNLWVESETKGLINQLLHNRAFESLDLILVHANALYFNGKWEHEFLPENSSIENFYLLNGRTPSINVLSMCRYGTCYDYASFDDYKVLRMPYKCSGAYASRQFSMIIVLPKEIKGLPDLIEKFRENPNLLSRENLNLENETIDILRIPRFKHSYSFNPMDVMKELGLTLPFKKDNEELKGMVDDDNVSVYVSKVLQHIQIECNEQGTEVVCCTEAEDDDMGFSFDSPPRPPPITFIANRPFMFMIKEDVSDTIFFLGVICNPQSEVFKDYEEERRKDQVNDDSDDDMGFTLFD